MNLDTGLITVLITILLAIIGFVFGYGALSNKVNGHASSIKDLQSSNRLIDTKLDLILTRLAVIDALANKIKEK